MTRDCDNWLVYLLKCSNGSLYCGITNNLKARFEAHKNGTGAKYTRANPPVRVVAVRQGLTKSQAARVEYLVKRLPAGKKVAGLHECALSGKKGPGGCHE